MAVDVKKIADARKAERDGTMNIEARQAVALEQIADTLKALRQEVALFSHSLARILQNPPPK